jgi:hypothetical protein
MASLNILSKPVSETSSFCALGDATAPTSCSKSTSRPTARSIASEKSSSLFLLRFALQVLKDCSSRKWQAFRLTRWFGCRFLGGAHARLAPLRELCFNFFLAIEQTLNRPLARFGFPGVERLFNAPQHHVKRHFHLFPTFNESPIHWAQQQVLCAPADEDIFDFGKIIKIVQLEKSILRSNRLESGLVRRVTFPKPRRTSALSKRRVAGCVRELV